MECYFQHDVQICKMTKTERITIKCVNTEQETSAAQCKCISTTMPMQNYANVKCNNIASFGAICFFLSICELVSEKDWNRENVLMKSKREYENGNANANAASSV